jgi:hypothetical protein
MTDTARLRRRRKGLLALSPRCHWCGREVREYDIAQPKEDYPEDMATMDHLDSRVRYPGGRPRYAVFSAGPRGITRTWAIRTVLSCWPCNRDRAVDEKRGIEWTPGCRAAAGGTVNGVASG